MDKFTKKYFTLTKIFVAHALIGQLSFLLVPNILLSKMNNHEHQTKQIYDSYTSQPLMSFSVAYQLHALLILAVQREVARVLEQNKAINFQDSVYDDSCVFWLPSTDFFLFTPCAIKSRVSTLFKVDFHRRFFGSLRTLTDVNFKHVYKVEARCRLLKLNEKLSYASERPFMHCLYLIC